MTADVSYVSLQQASCLHENFKLVVMLGMGLRKMQQQSLEDLPQLGE
jgi:hypothetical protein